MSDHGKNERRKFPRVKFDDQVTIHQVTESKSGNVFEVQGNPIVVKAQDVSEGGIRLELADSTGPSKILKVNFQIQKNKSVDVYTKLAWKSGDSCGLQFIVLDDETRKQIQSFVDKQK